MHVLSMGEEIVSKTETSTGSCVGENFIAPSKYKLNMYLSRQFHTRRKAQSFYCLWYKEELLFLHPFSHSMKTFSSSPLLKFSVFGNQIKYSPSCLANYLNSNALHTDFPVLQSPIVVKYLWSIEH